jgi:hypothetical protein
MAVIFQNLSRQTLGDRPATAYADYLAWMRHFTALSWPGRQDPLAEGEPIELALISGESIARHTFGLQTTQDGAGYTRSGSWKGWSAPFRQGRPGCSTRGRMSAQKTSLRTARTPRGRGSNDTCTARPRSSRAVMGPGGRACGIQAWPSRANGMCCREWFHGSGVSRLASRRETSHSPSLRPLWFGTRCISWASRIGWLCGTPCQRIPSWPVRRGRIARPPIPKWRTGGVLCRHCWPRTRTPPSASPLAREPLLAEDRKWPAV